MTPEQFMENFGVLAEAPQGIPKLRELVLSLAVLGKMQADESSDEDARLTLSRIVNGKGAPRKRAGASTSPRRAEPDSDRKDWAATTLGEVTETIQIGPFGSQLHKRDYVENGTPLVNPQNIKLAGIKPTLGKTVTPETLVRLSRYVLRAGDVVMGRRGEMGKCARITEQEDGWLCGTGSLFFRLPPEVAPEFLVIFLRSPVIRARLVAGAVGATMKNLSHKAVASIPLRLPALAEQKRIVARVDQLMAMLDDLEQRQEKKRTVAIHISKASVDCLVSAEDPDQLARAWERVYKHFGTVARAEKGVARLREAILGLAFSGRLSPKGSPVAARSLATSILTERAARHEAHLASGGRKKSKVARSDGGQPTPPFRRDDWQWLRLEEATDPVRTITYGILKPGPDNPGGPRYVKVKHMRGGRIAVHKLPGTTEEIYANYLRSTLAKGDVLLSIRGTYGTVAAVPDEIEGANITQDSCRIAPSQGLDRKFLIYMLRAPQTQGYFRSTAKGAAVQGINIGDVRQTWVPLPAHDEQLRIVAKVDHLMGLVHDLERHATRLHEATASLAVVASRTS